MTMRGGELIVRSAFPSNFTAPTFKAGRVNFDGTGNVTIPSSLASNGVAQYYNLKIAGDNRDGNIRLSSSGDIVIINDLDLSSLKFANNNWRFLTNGSTVKYNKDTGIQNISYKPAYPSDSLCYLEYYNLVLDGGAVKKLNAVGASYFKVTKDITISNNAIFDANNSNIEIQGNWKNISGSFLPGTGTVMFTSPVATLTTNLTSRDTAANPFNNFYIKGSGIFKPLDNLKIRGSLVIDSFTNFAMDSASLYLQGDWTNNGGSFSQGTSTVYFIDSTRAQILTKVSNDALFYNLTINNKFGVNAYQIGGTTNGIVISKNLDLPKWLAENS